MWTGFHAGESHIQETALVVTSTMQENFKQEDYYKLNIKPFFIRKSISV
jgi:hypothetical protein